MKAVKLRSYIPSSLFGLGIELDHMFGFKPVGNYMFQVNKRNSRARCEICSKLTIKTPERHQWHRYF